MSGTPRRHPKTTQTQAPQNPHKPNGTKKHGTAFRWDMRIIHTCRRSLLMMISEIPADLTRSMETGKSRSYNIMEPCNIPIRYFPHDIFFCAHSHHRPCTQTAREEVPRTRKSLFHTIFHKPATKSKPKGTIMPSTGHMYVSTE